MSSAFQEHIELGAGEGEWKDDEVRFRRGTRHEPRVDVTRGGPGRGRIYHGALRTWTSRALLIFETQWSLGKLNAFLQANEGAAFPELDLAKFQIEETEALARAAARHSEFSPPPPVPLVPSAALVVARPRARRPARSPPCCSP